MIPTNKEKLVDRMMTKIQIPNKKIHQPFGRKQSESNILETTSKDVDFNKLKKPGMTGLMENCSERGVRDPQRILTQRKKRRQKV